MKTAFLTSLLSLLVSATADENYVLPPPASDGPAPLATKLLIYMPGAAVPNVNYTQPLTSIQQESQPEVDLWVGVPATFKRKCIITCSSSKTCFPLHDQVNDVIQMAVDAGFKGDIKNDVIIGGHSLGATCANYLTQGYPDVYTNGLLLHGGYIDEISENGSLMNYPSPVMMVGVELDGGLARPGKMAQFFRQHLMLTAEIGEEEAALKGAVVILPGLDHSDFCPGFAVPGDLPSEVTTEEANRGIGVTSASWIKYLVTRDASSTAYRNLSALFDFTAKFLKPYYSALDLEVTLDDNELHNLEYLGVTGGSYSPWCEVAQKTLAGPEIADKILISRGCDVEGFEESRSCAYLNETGDLEHSRSQYAVDPENDNILLVNVSGHADYYANHLNLLAITAASEVACKMVSGARLAEQLKIDDYGSKTSVGTCQDVNKKALEIATQLLSGTKTLARYTEKGRKVCFGEDFEAFFSAGPAWIKETIELNDEGECLDVASVKIETELDSRLFPGVHYCKLLSPARIVDWMMSDSLQAAK